MEDPTRAVQWLPSILLQLAVFYDLVTMENACRLDLTVFVFAVVTRSSAPLAERTSRRAASILASGLLASISLLTPTLARRALQAPCESMEVKVVPRTHAVTAGGILEGYVCVSNSGDQVGPTRIVLTVRLAEISTVVTS